MGGSALLRVPRESHLRERGRRARPQSALRLYQPALVRPRRVPRDRGLHGGAHRDPRAARAGRADAAPRRRRHRRRRPRLRCAVPASGRPLPDDGDARVWLRHHRGHPEPRHHPRRRRAARARGGRRRRRHAGGHRTLLPHRGHRRGDGRRRRERRAHTNGPRVPGAARERDRRGGERRAGGRLQDARLRGLGVLYRRRRRPLRLRRGLSLARRLRRVPVRGFRRDDHRRWPRLRAGIDRRRRHRHRAARFARGVSELSAAHLRRHPDRVHALHARRHRGRHKEDLHAPGRLARRRARHAQRGDGGSPAGRHRHRDRDRRLQLVLGPARLHG